MTDNPLDEPYTQVEYDLFLLASGFKKLEDAFIGRKSDEAFLSNELIIEEIHQQALNLMGGLNYLKGIKHGQKTIRKRKTKSN